MNKKQKIIVSITGITIVLLALIGLTYAYFLTRIQGNTNEKSISVTTANLRLIYGDGSDGVIGGTNIMPSDTVYSKTFTVKNEGDAISEYGVFLINVTNTFTRKDDIKYTLSCTTDGEIACNEVTSETTFPSGLSRLVTNKIEPGKTHTYTLKFTYKDSGTDQSIDMNKELSAKIQIFGANGNSEYFPYETDSAAYELINNIKKGTTKSTFVENLSATGLVSNHTTADDKIISTAIDDYGTTYYYRGNVEDNYLSFAGMCFRIVRIEGDGSIKLILASELECSETNLTSDSAYATDGAKGVKGTVLKANYGIKSISKYKYVNDYINSEYNKENSVRVKLNEWLERKITSESDIALLKSDTWCIGDLTNAYDNSGNILGKIDDLISTKTSFYYSSGYKYNVTKTPSYKCTTTGVEGETDINKVGMLTFDEVIYAGVNGTITDNSNYLLNNSNSGDWLLLSPGKYVADESGTTVFLVSKMTGIYTHYQSTTNLYMFKPSITLKSNVKITSGDGTISNPYKIS